MKKYFFLLSGIALFLIAAGCNKDQMTDADSAITSSVPHLKISGVPVEFPGIGSVTLTYYDPSFTQSEFWFEIKATGTTVVKLDLGVQVDYRGIEVLSISGATANYAGDPVFKKYPAYKDVKWLILSTQVQAGSTSIIKLALKGYWNAEPRKSMLVGSSGFAEGMLEVPVREPGTLSVVETLSLLPAADGSFTVNCAVLDDGGSEVYERGVFYNYSPFTGPYVPAEAVKVVAGSGVGNYTCIIPGLEGSETIYAMAYAYNRCTGTYLDNTLSFGSQLMYPEPVFNYQQNFTDIRDGKVYKTLVMNDGKEWMVENLAWLPADNWFWRTASRKLKQYSGIYVYNYFGTSAAEARLTPEFTKYGCLYDFEKAKTACPPGSHLPSDEEWKALEKAYGMADSELDILSGAERITGAVGAGLKTTSVKDWFWYDVSGSFAGNNRTGFSAIGSGRVIFMNGNLGFAWLGQDALFWTSTLGPNGPIFRDLKYAGAGVIRFEFANPTAFSVRCIIDR
jgi:uncharacterized protein (TIGR02145 family)